MHSGERTLAHGAVIPRQREEKSELAAPTRREIVAVAESIRPRKGARMPTVIAYHEVKDTQHWLASPKREEVFGPLGVTNIRTFVDQENPKRVAVLMDVADMDAVMAAMQTSEMASAMDYDGVLPETLVILTEA
jgi:hypothetical protein